jgi:phosphatidylethanolamine/phosphatidyl-N-methylethanolamine N-methyltransferase
MRMNAVFLRQALRRPTVVGAPAPTGSTVAAEIAAVVPRVGTVVELGVGTGALVPAIRARLAPEARYLAVEIDDRMVAHLRRRSPGLEVLCGDAAELDALLAAAGVGQVDAVVSSLPWTLFTPTRRDRTLDAVRAVLTPGGVFATIVTVTAPHWRVHQLRARLHTAFDQVLETRTVWRNVPPARLFVCRRPC